MGITSTALLQVAGQLSEVSGKTEDVLIEIN